MASMRVYGLLVDLSWELKVDKNVPVLGALVANTPAADPAAKTQVWEVGVEEDDADAFRVLIGRLVAITADFRDGGLRATPQDIVMQGSREDLSRLAPLLPRGPPRGEDGPRLCGVSTGQIRVQRYEARKGGPVRVAYEMADLAGPVYAERVFAAYDLMPWLRGEGTTLQSLLRADDGLAVFKYARSRPSLVGLLPHWR